MQKRDSLLARGLDLMSPVRSCQLLSSFQIRCLIAVFFFGVSALTFEILWQRQMFLIFGASAPATTAVLTAIFLKSWGHPSVASSLDKVYTCVNVAGA